MGGDLRVTLSRANKAPEISHLSLLGFPLDGKECSTSSTQATHCHRGENLIPGHIGSFSEQRRLTSPRRTSSAGFTCGTWTAYPGP
ncbi:hypothetical protein RRG08_007865 [Elysia crispata]|uniref:Uncharacterized protein n=1 Tax=Elysia crispata TaxID=231223 RepID=A0AAE0XW60_9GAST|nr:hypothetical protein RRG08_007865 [Elysia crispata]